ncbi:hypothetical protein [Microbulbifer sp. CNSA002]|uniref:hypothetical protein n=1 Tax=unclassified Microbulbifer TaxID=2619833 RepID=UPI0039B5C9FE
MRVVFVVLALIFGLAGCVQQYVFNHESSSQIVEEPQSDKAQIIFLRPSAGVFAGFNALVFDITDDNDQIVGVASAKSKFLINVDPGTYTFMATEGIKGHVMQATVEPGQRYYIVVRPIYGQGFQLRPMKNNIDGEFSLESSELQLWLSKTLIVDKSSGADDWHASYEEKVQKVKEKAYEVWAEKSDDQRQLLTIDVKDRVLY